MHAGGFIADSETGQLNPSFFIRFEPKNILKEIEGKCHFMVETEDKEQSENSLIEIGKNLLQTH